MFEIPIVNVSEMVDELKYSCYRFNRGDSPTTTPEQWAAVFGVDNTKAMEERLQAELSSRFGAILEGCLPKWSSLEGYQLIRGRDCEITLEPRPSYCDRGNFIARIEVTGDRLRLDIDYADGWPRYYFDEQRAKAEIEAWLVKRKQV